MAQRCLLLCISSSLIGALAEDGAGFTASLDLRATLHLPRDVPRTAALARGAVEASVLDALRLNVDEITARWRSAAAAPPTAATIARTIERGVAAQQTGTTRGIADAVALYRDVLAREPEHADALHLLGLAVPTGTGAEKADPESENGGGPPKVSFTIEIGASGQMQEVENLSEEAASARASGKPACTRCARGARPSQRKRRLGRQSRLHEAVYSTLLKCMIHIDSVGLSSRPRGS
jgi:hypothetical protein